MKSLAGGCCLMNMWYWKKMASRSHYWVYRISVVKRNFHSYGDMKKAYTGSESYGFKILMSHDPSHWDAEVRKNYTDIDLMLSGHTHGMQFGVEIPGFKWSPVQYIYKQWAGLYEAQQAEIVC